MMTQWSDLTDQVSVWARLSTPERARLVDSLDEATPWSATQLAGLLQAVAIQFQSPRTPLGASRNWEPLWTLVGENARILRGESRAKEKNLAEENEVRQAVAELADRYRALPEDAPRWEILAWLSAVGRSVALAALAELLTEQPPKDFQKIALALAPLFRFPPQDVAGLFPDLLGALVHEPLAAPVLDLANFLTRCGSASEHPAAAHFSVLVRLFEKLVGMMHHLETNPAEFAQSPAELAPIVARSVSLGIALADALALIGNQQAVPALRKALTLGHRTLRAEAASALARLGVEEGLAMLITLAADPAIRTKAVSFVEELEQTEKIPAEFLTPYARAEGDLAAWLSQPTAFGLPPSELELAGQWALFWPGYEERQDCFLIQYTYHLPNHSVSGLGIGGPACYAFLVDWGLLPPTDVLAAYCGWHAEHEEMRERTPDMLTPVQQNRAQTLAESLQRAGFSQPQLVKWGEFFGSEICVFSALRADQPGYVFSEMDKLCWFPANPHPRGAGLKEFYYCYTGHKLLETFNPDWPPPELDSAATP